MLRQGGSDGGFPPADDLGPGPTFESVDSDSIDSADIPVPDDGTDFDADDEDFWAGWLKEIKKDEYQFVEVFHARERQREGPPSADSKRAAATLLRPPARRAVPLASRSCDRIRHIRRST